MTQTFTYRQAALRGEASYIVHPTGLEKTGDDGWHLKFSDISAATYTVVGTKAGASRELMFEAGETRKVFYVGPGGDNADNVTFLALCKAIGQGLEAAQPGFQIARGFNTASRRWMFIASLFSIAVAGALGVAMVLAQVNIDVMIAQAFPLIGLLLFGLWGIRSFSPTRKPAMIKAQYFPNG